VPKVFLSYNTKDEWIAATVRTALDARGWTVFYAPWSLHPGAYWMPALAEEVDSCDAFVILATDSGLGSWQLLEYYAAMDRRAQHPEFSLIPALVGSIQPNAPFLRTLHWLRIASSETAGPQIVAALDRKSASDSGALWRFANPTAVFNPFARRMQILISAGRP
jgi:hypothetical protein